MPDKSLLAMLVEFQCAMRSRDIEAPTVVFKSARDGEKFAREISQMPMTTFPQNPYFVDDMGHAWSKAKLAGLTLMWPYELRYDTAHAGFAAMCAEVGNDA